MRHHYVPEFLQKPWTENSPDGKLEVFRIDLPNIPSSRHMPKFTGFEHNLFALSEDVIAGMDKQAIETRFLRIVDNNAANIRNKLLGQGFKTLTPEDRVDWARFLMSLRLRQPDIVNLLKQESAEHLKATLIAQPEDYEALTTTGDPPTLEAWTERQYPCLIENFGLSYFHELVDNPKYGNKILRMNWWLWDFNKVPYDLLLSDNPCIFTSGIDDPGCVIALPIHPRKAFFATQSDDVAQSLRQQNLKDLAMRLNESLVSQARVRIYARNDSPRHFIEKRVAMQKSKTEDSNV